MPSNPQDIENEYPIADRGRPFEELRSDGMLWLINATVFHPRGYALAFHFDSLGQATGWSLMGDGTESWQFGCDEETQARVGEAFRATKDLLS